MHLNVELITNEVLTIGRDMASIAAKAKTFLSSPNAEAVAAMFPGGTAIDSACIALCNDAITGANLILKAEPAITSAASQVDGMFKLLGAQLTQLNHNNPKHGLGYYLKVIGNILEDAASLL